MGTNYYLGGPTCERCGLRNKNDDLHIGKSSRGWKFLLRAHRYTNPPIWELADWLKHFEAADTWVYDEYGDQVDKDEMVEIITKRNAWRVNGKLYDHFRPEFAKCSYMYTAGVEGDYDITEGEFS